MTIWWLSLAGAYLLGSIPFGLLIGRSRGIDIRKSGSGNVGATNVGRLLGRRFGVICFGLDAAKGACSVLGAGFATGVWGRPVIARYRMRQKLYRSERESTRCPSACSGAMYRGVPTITCWVVAPPSSSSLATPKSTSFQRPARSPVVRMMLWGLRSR